MKGVEGHVEAEAGGSEFRTILDNRVKYGHQKKKSLRLSFEKYKLRNRLCVIFLIIIHPPDSKWRRLLHTYRLLSSLCYLAIEHRYHRIHLQSCPWLLCLHYVHHLLVYGCCKSQDPNGQHCRVDLLHNSHSTPFLQGVRCCFHSDFLNWDGHAQQFLLGDSNEYFI